MAGITARRDVDEVDTCGADAIQGKGKQCAADTPALPIRIDGDHAALRAGRALRDGGSDASGRLRVELGAPDREALVPAHPLDRTSLARGPVRIDDPVEGGAEYPGHRLVDRPPSLERECHDSVDV